MMLLHCHAGCTQPAVMDCLRSLGAWGPNVSDEETLRVLKAKRHGKYFTALCPAHPDTTPSLSLTPTNDTREVIVPWGDPVAIYPYHDEAGAVLYEFVRRERYVDGRREKQLRPRLPGAKYNGIGETRRVLYRLPEVLANPIVVVCEGEKDAETLRAHGFVATCNPFGAGKWRDEYSGALHGKSVILLPDNDVPGRSHSIDVAKRLFGIAATLAVVEVPGAKDISDWFAAGHSELEFLELLEREAFV